MSQTFDMSQTEVDPGDARSRRVLRVLIVDDHAMLAASLAAMIDGESDMSVIGAVASLGEARAFLTRESADVVLLDHRLPDGLGGHSVGALRDLSPDARIVIMTAAADDSALVVATEQGAAGFISKTAGVDELLSAIRVVAAGEMVVAPSLLSRLLPRMSSSRTADKALISARELEVLRLMAEGSSTKEIAASLHLSVNTVRNHTQNILSKLNVHSKLEAVAKAIREELVTPPARGSQ